MKSFVRFVKTTLVGGLLFLLPLIVMIVLLREAIVFVAKVLHPIAEKLPFDRIAGVHARDLLAAILLVVVAFGAGLLARTDAGKSVSARLEAMILRKVPGFNLLKSATSDAVGQKGADDVQVAMASLDDAWMLCFIVERLPNGLLTVFIPSAPTPAAGSIYYLREDQVRRVDVPVGEAAKVMMRLGVGSKDLLRWTEAGSPPSAEERRGGRT